jgi:hypothetical protein
MFIYSIQPHVGDSPPKPSVTLKGVNRFRLATAFSQHLRNHFDAADPENMEQLDVDLSILKQIVKKLIKMK